MTLHYPDDDSTLPEIVKSIDGLLMVGGDDIPPECYPSEHPDLVVIPTMAPERERFDRGIVQETLKNGKPVLAICVGLQHINVIHGGSLYEDINALVPNHVNHGVFNGAWVEHTVNLTGDSLVASIMGETTPSVASTHHQGIRALGEGLIPTGYADDGLIESVESESYPDLLIAVQWHPELLTERREHLALFQWLVSTSGNKKGK